MPNLTRQHEQEDASKTQTAEDNRVSATHDEAAAATTRAQAPKTAKQLADEKAAAEAAALTHPERREMRVYSGFFTSVQGDLLRGGGDAAIVSHVRNSLALAKERLENDRLAAQVE